MNVVVVDDERVIVEGLKKIIKRDIPACKVIGTAHNGVEGGRLIGKLKPDIVITDIRMPQADGLQMIQQLKADGCTAKFIILSGYAEFEYARKGMQLGVQFYINKPVEEEELQECMSKVMVEIITEKAQLEEVDMLKNEVKHRTAESVLWEMMDGSSDRSAYVKYLLDTVPYTVSSAAEQGMLSDELMKSLDACLDNSDVTGSLAVIGEIADILAAGNLDLPQFRFQCLRILLAGVRKIPLDQLQHNEFLKRHILYLEQVTYDRASHELTHWLEDAVKWIIETRSARYSAKKKDLIGEIKEYMASHYQENISLAELSSLFYINPYYLSQLFKQKTGDTYMHYLVKIRINKARELLEKTDMKVYEICQMVGYSDTNHFAKQFEKLTGYKPAEYRKRRYM